MVSLNKTHLVWQHASTRADTPLAFLVWFPRSDVVLARPISCAHADDMSLNPSQRRHFLQRDIDRRRERCTPNIQSHSKLRISRTSSTAAPCVEQTWRKVPLDSHRAVHSSLSHLCREMSTHSVLLTDYSDALLRSVSGGACVRPPSTQHTP